MSDDSSHSLVILTDDGEEVFPVTIGETTIGRTRSNHLTLRESSVSRSHCRIERTDDETRIYDAAPRNPTRLRRAGDDLTKNANGKVLRDGDTIILGRVEIVYRGVWTARLALPAGSASREEGGSPVVGAIEMTSDAPRAPSTRSAPHRPAAHESPRPAAVGAASRPSSSGRRRRVVTITSSRNDSALLVGGLAFVGFLAAIVVVATSRSSSPDGSGRQASEQSGSTARVESRGISQREARLLARLEERERQLELTRSQIGDLRDLQRRLEEALQQGREKRATARPADGEPGADEWSQGGPSAVQLVETREAIARLVRRESDIRGDLEQLKVHPLDGVDDPAVARSIARRRETVDGGRTGRIGGRIEDIEDDPEIDDELGSSRGTTVVEKVPQRTQLSGAQYNDLVDRLKETVGNYGLPSASPEDLEPDLTALLESEGELSARGLVAVFEYSQKLERDMSSTVSMLQRRVEGLLAQAGGRQGGKKGRGYGKSEGGESYYRPQRHSQHLEQLQRLLELSDKKIQIKKQQRVRLEAFQGRLGEAFAALTRTEATLQLVKTFGKSRENAHLRRHICGSFARSHALQAVPALIKALRVKDTRLKSTVHRTLVTIAGKDLGDAVGPWNDWYRSETDG